MLTCDGRKTKKTNNPHQANLANFRAGHTPKQTGRKLPCNDMRATRARHRCVTSGQAIIYYIVYTDAMQRSRKVPTVPIAHLKPKPEGLRTKKAEERLEPAAENSLGLLAALVASFEVAAACNMATGGTISSTASVVLQPTTFSPGSLAS